MFAVEVDDVASRLPIEVSDGERDRMEKLIDDAIEQIEVAFMKEGRVFHREVEHVEWLPLVATRVVREMVSAAVMVGENTGVRSVSSTTGPTNDSITFADVDSVSWGGVMLTPKQMGDLGLSGNVRPRGSFPRGIGWPEVVYPWNQ